MKVINYCDFRNNLAERLNLVNEDREIVVVSPTMGKNVVVMDFTGTIQYKKPCKQQATTSPMQLQWPSAVKAGEVN